MRIDCYLSAGCRSEEALKENITKALEITGLPATLNIERLGPEEARELMLKGSPAIFINGCNMFPVEGPIGFS